MQRRVCLSVAALSLLNACAFSRRSALLPAPGQAEAPPQTWSGRLSLVVQSQPPQQMSAGFELQGMPKNGQLHFFTPLGTNLASLQWTTQGAQLLQGSQSQHFESLDALSEQLTGASLPIAELFDWLQGIHTQALGWEADLSQVSEGTLSAKRTNPMPAVVLRIKLD